VGTEEVANMDCYFTGNAVCNRCGANYSWYCTNLSLARRERGVPVVFSEPSGVHMSYSGYFKNGVPEFQGYCSACGRIATLPSAIVSTIPAEFYTDR